MLCASSSASISGSKLLFKLRDVEQHDDKVAALFSPNNFPEFNAAGDICVVDSIKGCVGVVFLGKDLVVRSIGVSEERFKPVGDFSCPGSKDCHIV